MPDPIPFSPDSPAHALSGLLARLPRVSTETIPRASSAGRVLAQPLHTDRPSPAIDVSQMDGFAVHESDLERGALPVTGDARIGMPPIALEPGAAARIVTGAPIPKGADCVIRVEDTQATPSGITFRPELAKSLPPNRFVRRRGENAAANSEFAPAGTLITPALASALASCGIVAPTVFRRVRVAILSTGDEVLPPDATPLPWQLRDGNSAALHSLLSTLPFVESIEARHAPDDQRQILSNASELLSRSDALFLSGGVSMGHRDLVPAALAQLGARTVFHKVPQRPGKPLFAAVGPRDQLILGLPGNPVSVHVTATRFGIPALHHIAGITARRPVPAISVANPDGQSIALWWYRLVKLTSDGLAELIENKGSGDLVASSRSDGFIEIPPNTTTLGPFPFYAWRS